MPAKAFEASTAVLIAVLSVLIMSLIVSVLFLSRALLYAGTAAMTSRAALSAAAGGCRVVSESHLSRRGIEAYITAFIALSETYTPSTLSPTDADYIESQALIAPN